MRTGGAEGGFGVTRFNGAAARELRMPLDSDVQRSRHHASMGPQLVSCGCGLRRVHRVYPDPASMGPQLVSCGCDRCVVPTSAPRMASMGPQLVSCGCDERTWTRGRPQRASMGPQLVSCGCEDPLLGHEPIEQLQWGRSS